MSSLDPFSPDFFTARECEINLLLLKGIHPTQMPLHSTMKYDTIKTHLKDMRQKTHTDSVQQLILWLIIYDWEVTMEVN